jgi:tetratricopeptide (TPR) repeat protein
LDGCLPEDRLKLWIAGRPPVDGQAEAERAHLAGCHACRAVIAFARTSTLSITAPSDGAPPPLTPRLERGGSVGRYIIVGVLGQGGMGVVYAAYDPELDRKVALKLLRPGPGEDADSAGFRDRLRREAQAMARLRHPNVIKVYDVGTKPDELFVAMELVDGVTLAGWLKERRRSWREIVDVFRKAGAGLAAAHEAGLVHRDFKPDNVLISRAGDVFVTDFGLARAMSAIDTLPSPTPSPSPSPFMSPLATPLTITGALVGTPIYMAPEQLYGVAADARSDVYSYCTALYEALFGQRPYDARTVEELRAQVTEGRLREPSGGRCPAWLRRIVMRGLRIDPAARYASMRALDDELSRDPSARWRRIGAGAGALLIVATMVMVPRELTRRQQQMCRGSRPANVWIDDHDRFVDLQRAFAKSGRAGQQVAFSATTKALDDYALAWLRGYEDNCAATRIRGEQSTEMLDLRTACLDSRMNELQALVRLFEHADGALVDRAAAAVGSLQPISSCSADALLHAGSKLPSSPAARVRWAAVEADIAKVKAHEIAGRYKDEAPLVAGAIAEAEREKFGALEAEARYWNGVLAYHFGKLDDAEAELGRTGALAQTVGRDDIAARAYAFLGFLLGSQQRHFDAAHLAFSVAKAASTRSGNQADVESARLRLEASALTNEGRLPDAIDDYKRALEMQRRTVSGPSFKEAELTQGLARAYTEAGHNSDALDAIDRACAIYEKLFGPSYPMIGEAQLQRGFILRQLGRGDEAVAAMQRALRTREQNNGPDHPNVVEALVYLGDTFSWRGRPAEGVPYLERAIAVGERIKTPYPDVPAALINLGWAHLKLGEPRRARDDFERALAHPKASELGFEIGEAKFGLAQSLWSVDRARAAALASEARAVYDKQTNAESKERKVELARWLDQHRQ